jgi:general secretion pathway protein A
MTLLDPFSTSPSPAALFLTTGLKKAIQKTKLCVERRHGLTAILGDVGMGKSSLLRHIYGDYAAREDVALSFIPTPAFSTDFAFLKTICADLGLSPKRSMLEQQSALNEFLLAQYQDGRNVVVFVDEAQRLPPKQLEVVRTLLNYETNTAKLIQVVLSGQLELRERLLEEKQKAIRSRLFAPSVLDPLSLSETEAMIRHRCDLAGVTLPFSSARVAEIYEATGGVPREILKVCAVAYALARINDLDQVPAELVAEALREAVLA